ncbi:MAG: reverse transcriptase-like protein [Candidatus Saccharimonadales bacterium]
MWQKKDDSLYRKFEFNDFEEAFSFVEKVADVARGLNHHPKIINDYSTVELWLSTHAQGGVATEKDEQFAGKVDDFFDLKKTKKDFKLKEAKLYTDGGSRGNPGPSALGYAIFNQNDKIIEKNSRYLGIATNNQAEYQALKEGLEASLILGVKKIDVFMDSLLVVNQLKGLYKVKNGDLIPVNQAVRRILTEFDSYSLTHIPREQNTVADSMVNECLDEVKNSDI